MKVIYGLRTNSRLNYYIMNFPQVSSDTILFCGGLLKPHSAVKHGVFFLFFFTTSAFAENPQDNNHIITFTP